MYIVSKNGSYIYDADIDLNVSPNVVEEAFSVVFDGYYEINVNASLLEIQTYIVNVTLQKMYFEKGTIIIRVDVVPIPTSIIFSQKSAEIEYGDNITFSIWYKVYDSGEDIPFADVATFEAYYSEYLVMSGDVEYEQDLGRYVLSLSALKLMENLYVISKDNLSLPLTFSIFVRLGKSVYAHKVDIVTVTVYNIACYTETSSTEIFAEWGQNISIEIRVIRNRTLTPIYNFSMHISGIPDGSWQIKEYGLSYFITINTSMLEIVEIANKSYFIVASFEKEYHEIPSRTITLTIRKVEIDITVISPPPESVTRWQIFEESKVTNIDLLLEHNGDPIENAEIVAIMYSLEANINRTIYAVKTDIPGKYKIMINWQDFEPGYKWTIIIKVLSARIYGLDLTNRRLTHGEISYYVFMDYFSGSTRITVPIIKKKIHIANVFYYPLLIAMLFVLSYVGYKFFSWYFLPWEVKELGKILKMISKEKYDYGAPERRDYITKMISEELDYKQ